MTDLNDRQTQAHAEAVETDSLFIQSPKGNWCFGQKKQVALDTGEHQHPVHVVTMVTSPTAIEQFVNGKLVKHSAHLNNTFVLPMEALHRFIWQQNVDFIFTGFSPGRLQQVGQDLLKGDRVELKPQLQMAQDPLIQGILSTLHGALKFGNPIDPQAMLYIDQLQLTLAMHVLNQYGVASVQVPTIQNGLSPSQLKRVLAYIDDHLDRSLSLEELAEQAGMSQFYFCRLFKQSMAVSPYQYIIQQKVKRAQHLLRTTPLPIHDIAIALGFTNQGQLTTHFRKIVGTTPTTYRKH